MKWRGFSSDKLSDHLRTLVLFRLGGRAIRLHDFRDIDTSGVYHGHPARSIRIILYGGYDEELPDGHIQCWRPGMIGYVRPEFQHRIVRLAKKNSLSLWIRGRKRFDVKVTSIPHPLKT